MADFIKAIAHLKAASRHLLNAIDLADDLRRTLAQAEPERNFCPRCGKRLSSDGIHTCTPPQTKCSHCASPLFAALECRVCGRKTEWVCPDAPDEKTYQEPGHCDDCGLTLVRKEKK